MLAIAAGAIPAHFAAVGGNRLARIDGLDGDARAYVERRTTEGRTLREIRRCLKRYLAREIYRRLNTAARNELATT